MKVKIVFSMAVLLVFMLRERAFADSSTPFDQRSCVCGSRTTHPHDVFTATGVETSEGTYLKVADVLTQGPTDRQESGELAIGFERYSPGIMGEGPWLVYEGSARNSCCLIPIESLDLDSKSLTTLKCAVQPTDIQATRCETPFSPSQLQDFLVASVNEEGTCQALATKYLGIPKPLAQNDSMLQCGGGASPGWLVSILGALGLLACRARRRRPAER